MVLREDVTAALITAFLHLRVHQFVCDSFRGEIRKSSSRSGL